MKQCNQICLMNITINYTKADKPKPISKMQTNVESEQMDNEMRRRPKRTVLAPKKWKDYVS